MSTCVDYGHEPGKPMEERDPTPEEMEPAHVRMKRHSHMIRELMSNWLPEPGKFPIKEQAMHLLFMIESYFDSLCPQCGRPKDNDGEFCRRCGADVDADFLDPFGDDR